MRSTAALTVVALAVVGATAFYERAVSVTKAAVEVELTAVAAHEAGHVSQWASSILEDAEAVARSPELCRNVRGLVADLDPRHAQEAVRDRIAVEREDAHELGFVHVLSADGTDLFCGDGCSCEAHPGEMGLVRQVVATGRGGMSDLHDHADICGLECCALHVDVVVPFALGGDTVTMAVLFERVALDGAVRREISQYDGALHSAETFLARVRDGDLEMVVGESMSTGTPVRLSLAETLEDPVGGADGVRLMWCEDHERQDVFAAVTPVRGTPWWIVAKVDGRELTRVASRDTATTGILVYAVVGTGLLLVHPIRRRLSLAERMRARDAEQEIERLGAQLEHLTQDANDIILLLREDRSIAFCNERAGIAYGVPRDELCGRPFSVLVADDSCETLGWPDRRETSSFLAQCLHRRGDGTVFPVECSVRAIDLGSRLLFQLIVRDVTASKEAERQIARYQEDLRELAFGLQEAEERERRRIAEELHDSVGQSLVLLGMKLGALSELATAEAMMDLLRESCSLLDETIAETRTLSRQLSPPVLYDLGLRAALEWLAETLRDDYGMACRVCGDKRSDPLDAATRASIFACARELLLNIVKHAEAGQAIVSLRTEEDVLVVEVCDDGLGFEAPSAEAHARDEMPFGLFSVRERMRRLGGRVEIDSTEDGGTSVTLYVPTCTRPAEEKENTT